jgi:hypothetical protein
MSSSFNHIFTRLAPPRQRRRIGQRLRIVWLAAFVIGLAHWGFGTAHVRSAENLSIMMVYSYAISTLIWLFIDAGRLLFFNTPEGKANGYWPSSTPKAMFFLLPCIGLGYVLGTWLGDAYAGWSTLDLFNADPSKFWGILLSSIVISFGFYFYFSERSKAERLQHAATEAQLRLLQSQLEPHMLFNTLANLRTLIAHDTPKAQAMLDQLIAFLRATLQASRQPLHPLTDEFSRLHDYLSLMAIRMGPRLMFALDLPPQLAAANVPSFVLQPLVENAIRHGLEPVVAGGRIEVQADTQGAQLLLTVRDNGYGINELALAESAEPLPQSNQRPTASWGLAHVRQRLHTLYGERAGMHISPVPTGGTCVVLTLPLEINTTA